MQNRKYSKYNSGEQREAEGERQDPAIDADLRTAFVLTRDGTLEQYSYPEFKLRTSHRVGVTAFQAVSDGKVGKLYVAGFDPRTVAERPRAKGFGEVYIYDLKDLRTVNKE